MARAVSHVMDVRVCNGLTDANGNAIENMATTITPGTGATNLGKAEDAQHTSGDVGVMALAVAEATPATLGADGDYTPLQTYIGHLWVAPPITTKISTNFNRPANTTAYSANDAVNNNSSASGSAATELTFTIGRSAGTVKRVRLDKTGVANSVDATLRVWFYDTLFAITAGDNAAFTNQATDSIGYVDVALVNTGQDVKTGWTGCEIPHTGGTLYAQLQTLTAWTPASSETITLDIWDYPG